MISKRILFIDDHDITESINRLRKILGRSGYSLQEDFVLVSESKFEKAHPITGDKSIDKDKLKDFIEVNYFNEAYDVVACDIDFGDDYNGFELLTWIYNKVNNPSSKKLLRKSTFVFYSSEEQTIENVAKGKVIKLLRIKTEPFINRTDLPNELARLITKLDNQLDVTKEFQSMLEAHKEKIFKSTYTKFDGKSLGEILHEIEIESHHGLRYQKALIEQCISHMIDLQED